MLQADLFDDFKGGVTLLVWGDAEDMASFRESLSRLAAGLDEIIVGDGARTLAVGLSPQPGQSFVEAGPKLRWMCSLETLHLARELIKPLLGASGHQYVDASGDAEQIMISAGEYPAELR